MTKTKIDLVMLVTLLYIPLSFAQEPPPEEKCNINQNENSYLIYFLNSFALCRAMSTILSMSSVVNG